MLVFGQANRKTMLATKAALETLTFFTGMAINQRKSGLVLSTSYSPQLRQECVDILGIATVAFPIRYLGLPLAPGKLKHIDYNGLIVSMEKTLTRWWVAKLSYAGLV